MYIFAFIVFVLFYVTQVNKVSGNLIFILKQSLILSNFCVIVMRPVGDSHQNSDKVYCDS